MSYFKSILLTTVLIVLLISCCNASVTEENGEIQVVGETITHVHPNTFFRLVCNITPYPCPDSDPNSFWEHYYLYAFEIQLETPKFYDKVLDPKDYWKELYFEREEIEGNYHYLIPLNNSFFNGDFIIYLTGMDTLGLRVTIDYHLKKFLNKIEIATGECLTGIVPSLDCFLADYCWDWEDPNYFNDPNNYDSFDNMYCYDQDCIKPNFYYKETEKEDIPEGIEPDKGCFINSFYPYILQFILSLNKGNKNLTFPFKRV